MPTSNRHLPKIEHFGRPLQRSYRPVGAALATPIIQPWPPQAAPPRAGVSGYSDAVTKVAADFNPKKHDRYV